MADLSTTARPYAKAVFELAREGGKLKEWSAQLAALAQAVAQPELARLIGHPALSRSELTAIFSSALSKDLDAQGQSLLRLLSDNGRLKAAGSIAEQFEALRAEAEARVDVEVTTATTVGKPQQDALVSSIRKRLAREVVVEWKTDESLVAGALIRAGNLVIDGSVRGELERLQIALAG
jgi:F-type H+-transporting ATPase subunit delta